MSVTSRTIAVRDQQTHEPTINCPQCQTEIKLTESLAAPLLRSKELEFKRIEGELREREAALQRQWELSFDDASRSDSPTVPQTLILTHVITAIFASGG